MNAVIELPRHQGGALANLASGRMAIAEIIQHVQAVQEVMRTVMKEGVHYGRIPGTDKPTLLKPGAEALCLAFHIAPSYEVEDLSTPDSIRYRVNCIGTHQGSETVLGAGMGEGSSSEEKYKWRRAVCPEEFNETPANMRRSKFGKAKGGGFYKQEQVRTEPSDLANTVLKMANKRAHMAMVLNVTAASDCFNQDLEEMDEVLREHLSRQGEAPVTQQATQQAQQAEQTFYPQVDFDANKAIWKKVIAKGSKTPDQVIATVNSAPENKAMQLSPAQEAAIRALAPKAADKPNIDGPVMTFAKVMEMMVSAENFDALNDAAGLIAAVPDEVQRKELGEKYDARQAELTK